MAFNSDPEIQIGAQDLAMKSLASNDVMRHAWFHFVQCAYDKFIDGEEADAWADDLEELRGYQGKSRSRVPEESERNRN
jgi:hypothetical protein